MKRIIKYMKFFGLFLFLVVVSWAFMPKGYELDIDKLRKEFRI